MAYRWTLWKDPLKLEKVLKYTFKYNKIDYGATVKNSFIKPGGSCPRWLKITLNKELGHLVQKYRVAI